MKVRKQNEETGSIALDANKAVLSGKRKHEGLCKANIVNLNLKVLKEHVLRQDAFGFGYIVNTVDLVMELLVHSRRGVPQPLPLELIQIFDVAQNMLKTHRVTKKAQLSIKDYTRTYVSTWAKLVCFIAAKFDYFMVEYIMVESYNRISMDPYTAR